MALAVYRAAPGTGSPSWGHASARSATGFHCREVGKNAGMTVTETHRARDGGTDIAGRLAVVEEADVLFPGDADQHVDIPLQREIKQTLWRYIVGPDGVDARLSHQR